MKIFKATVIVGGAIHKSDAIEYEGKLWLVPHWLDMPAQGVTMPARIIRFDNRQYSDVRGTNLGDFVVNDSMPKELFDHQTPRQPIAGYEYLEMPEIRIPLAPRA
ncbi:MAG TPA: hypothetical protein VIJ78_10300, partial [Pseudolabrys sp.]